jgi:non-ribosomal peptide synthetase component F
MILAAAFQILLRSYGNQKDVLVGIPVSGRTIVETEGLIGLFVNTIVLRTTLSGNERFFDVLSQVRDSMLDALTNQEVPFELVVDAVQARRSLSYNPIFQIMFSTFRAAVQSRRFGHLTATPYIVESRAARFDLCVNIIEGVNGAWWAQAEYNTELFDGARISRMFEAYIHILRAAHADGHKRLSDLSLVLPGCAPGRSSPPDNISGSTIPSPQNRRAIPIQAGRNPASADGSPSSIAQGEQRLIPIWEKYLETSPIPVDADFFDLGGNSLLAIRLVASALPGQSRVTAGPARNRASSATLFAGITTLALTHSAV